MTAPWMDHPKLVAWFDDIEDAVTAAFALTDEQRRDVRALKAPRRDTWIMLARDEQTRDVLRDRMRLVALTRAVPVAADCSVLQDRGFGLGQVAFEQDALERETFDHDTFDHDTFDQDNGFNSIEEDYVEEGSEEALRRELLSDAEDYASSDESGWFYTRLDDEQDRNNDDPLEEA